MAALHAPGKRPAPGSLMEPRPEARRRARLFATPASFVVTILAIAAILAAVTLIIYALGGFGGEGGEGTLGPLQNSFRVTNS